MDNKLEIFDNSGKKLKLDVIISFNYNNDKYIVYTDNTYTEKGEYNFYGAKIAEDNKLEEINDADVFSIMEDLIREYKLKIIKGEL